MDLFGADPSLNLLPRDGIVHCHGAVFPPAEADRILSVLMGGIPWAHDETIMFGKRIVTARKVAWFADTDISYAYSGTIKQAHPWTKELLHLKNVSEKLTGATYNSCLLNLYHTGGEGMGWHSDDEKSIVPESSIGSLSFGAERKFSFRHKRTRETVSLTLEHGSLLDMRGSTQQNWLHQLPKTKASDSPRINLTFRRMA